MFWHDRLLQINIETFEYNGYHTVWIKCGYSVRKQSMNLGDEAITPTLLNVFMPIDQYTNGMFGSTNDKHKAHIDTIWSKIYNTENCHMSQFRKYQHSNWLLPMVSDTIFSLEWISLRWPLANDYVFPISTKTNGMSKARAFKGDSLNSVSISLASVTFLVQRDFRSSLCSDF